MAKLTVVGNTVILTSSFTAEEIDTIETFSPKYLELRDESSELRFRVCVEKKERISQYGVIFVKNASQPDQKASASVTLDGGVLSDDYLFRKFGEPLKNLKALESQWGTILEQIALEKNDFLREITKL